jgi:predicted RNase H-like HicB family nuclease
VAATPQIGTVFPVGLEEGSDGAVLVHSLSVPGCVSFGTSRDEALASFPDVLHDWLHFLQQLGDPVPELDSELEIAVEEWIRTEAEVGGGQSDACFDADREPIREAEITAALRRLGALRGRLLPRIRRVPEGELERRGPPDWPVRRLLDELARGQWWTLSRLGATPMAEVPAHLVGRLDTAMALVVQHLTELDPAARARVIELDGEEWTPRKVARRLLWLEWALGGAALAILAEEGNAL